VFSLGSVLVFAATGRAPFGRGQATAVLYRIVREEPDLSGLPPGLAEVIAACLAKNPDDRPELAELLSRFAGAVEVAEAWPPPAVKAMAESAPAAPETLVETSVDRAAVPPPAGPAATVPASGGRGRAGWVAGGAAAALAAAVSAVVFTAVLLSGDEKPGGRTAASASASTLKPVASQVVGEIRDTSAGLSYARLGLPWTSAEGAWRRPGLFTGGQVAAVQAPVNGASFNALSLSAPPRAGEREGYGTTADLPKVVSRVRERVLRELFTVQHVPTTVKSGRYALTGPGSAWQERLRLDLPQAQAKGWQVRSMTLAVLVVDHDGKAGGDLGMVLVALPDTFPAQGDLDQVLASVRVL
jgi:hypothetical protein